MHYQREVVANIHTGVLARWYKITEQEHRYLLAEAEAAGHVYMRPNGAQPDVATWRCRPPGSLVNGVGEFNLFADTYSNPASYAYIRFDAPGTLPTLF